MNNVVIKANIEENGLGGWLIRVTDSFDNKEYICKDMHAFSVEIERLGSLYEGNVEVQWSKDDNLSSQNFHQVQVQMAKYKEMFEKDENQKSVQ